MKIWFNGRGDISVGINPLDVYMEVNTDDITKEEIQGLGKELEKWFEERFDDIQTEPKVFDEVIA